MLEKPAIGEPCNACGLCCQLQICALGSFSMGLVREYGQRANGPCPALKREADDRLVCSMMLDPKRFSPAKRGSRHDLRAAAGTLIGAGIGCDEAGDEQDAGAKLRAVQTRFLERVGPDRINFAVKTWFGV